MTQVKKHRSSATGEQEYLCQCPRCLTLETLWFKSGFLVPTIKFSQGEDGKVYHDCNCGSVGPCRLFPERGVKPRTSGHR